MTPTILYDNLFLSGIPAADSTAVGSNVLNITDYKDFTFWKAASGGTHYISVDCGSPKTADAIGIYAHNLNASYANAQVIVEYSHDGAAWTQRLAGFIPKIGADVKTFPAISARYWRVKISTAFEAPQIGVLMLGKRLDMEQPQEAPVSYMNESITGKAEESITGNFLGAVVYNFPVSISANFKGFSKNWFDTNFLPFWNNHGKRLKPFFYAYDLENYPADTYYARLNTESVMNPTRTMLGRIEDFNLTMKAQSNVQ